MALKFMETDVLRRTLTSMGPRCWHNDYVTVSELAAHTETLLNESIDAAGYNGVGRAEKRSTEEAILSVKVNSIIQWGMRIGRMINGLWCGLGDWAGFFLRSTNEVTTTGGGSDNSGYKVDQDRLEDFTSKKAFCQELEKRGLLSGLCSGEPEQIGFTFDWYRHSL
ncbi:hypothetical protein ASPCAL14469 [Aspergillus calidoustus]|uniref:Uncharacterized protein n=1 Tax=Aspergillus calidoustus TaxID=454130 RepID=A0A0U5GHQ1_ASPCI|nr:hypothetical protein ASPCAL14469 [Aspergillus calidoustus]